MKNVKCDGIELLSNDIYTMNQLFQTLEFKP